MGMLWLQQGSQQTAAARPLPVQQKPAGTNTNTLRRFIAGKGGSTLMSDTKTTLTS